jgi:hypothetical protein
VEMLVKPLDQPRIDRGKQRRVFVDRVYLTCVNVKDRYSPYKRTYKKSYFTRGAPTLT